MSEFSGFHAGPALHFWRDLLAMSRPLVVLSLLLTSAILVLAQVDPNKLPTVTTGGNTNPEAISDINAQLIWLLAAAPGPSVGSPNHPDQTIDRSSASTLYQFTALPSVKPNTSEQLVGILGGFRSTYDSLVSDFNTRIASFPRDDVWREYRDFRVKINDLVTDTIRTLNTTFPEDASTLRSEIQRARDTISVSTYKSSSDPDYASNPRTAATGFAYIQGAVSVAAFAGDGKSPVHWVTAVMVGMVPGCPGKPFATATIDGAYMEGPKIGPWQYMDFQESRKSSSSQPSYFFAVQCAIPAAK